MPKLQGSLLPYIRKGKLLWQVRLLWYLSQGFYGVNILQKMRKECDVMNVNLVVNNNEIHEMIIKAKVESYGYKYDEVKNNPKVLAHIEVELKYDFPKTFQN